MTYDEINPVFREMLGTIQVFRKLGFLPDQLNAARNPNGDLFVVLSAQHKDFAVACGRSDMTKEVFEREWKRTALAWNESMADEDRTRIYSECNAFRHRMHLLLTLSKKGITYADKDREALN